MALSSVRTGLNGMSRISEEVDWSSSKQNAIYDRQEDEKCQEARGLGTRSFPRVVIEDKGLSLTPYNTNDWSLRPM